MSHKESLAVLLFGYLILKQDSIAWPALTTPFPQSACCDEEQEYYLQIEKERTELNSLFKQMKDFLYHYKHLQNSESLKKLYPQLLSLNKIKAFKNTHLKIYDFINTKVSHFNHKTSSFKIKHFKNVKELETGQCFGELALINDKPRAARIVTTESTVFGILAKYDYKKAVHLNMKRELELKFQFLKNFRLFSELSQIRL